MRRRVIFIAAIGVIAFAARELPGAFGPPDQTARTAAQKTVLVIPQSLQVEHREIHEALTRATQVPGAVGAAATELAAVLGPHFTRENEIALPPLGLLAALAAGEKPAGMQEALAMSDALRKELPRMLQEHTRIRAANEKLRAVAEKEKATAHAHLAEELALHARTEEEVLYPAAILVGDVIRARLKVP
jgi:hypothetical protein